jgi:preprotein translocase subunit SecE
MYEKTAYFRHTILINQQKLTNQRVYTRKVDTSQARAIAPERPEFVDTSILAVLVSVAVLSIILGGIIQSLPILISGLILNLILIIQ